jgi:ribonuclease P protein component
MPVTIRRLKKRADFLRVAKTRHKFAAPGLVLQVRCQPDDGGTGSEAAVRVGFTVSKKVGNAVERNRVRRRLRAVAADVLPERACAGRDYVIIGRRGALSRPYPSLRQDLETALQRTAPSKPCHGEARP